MLKEVLVPDIGSYSNVDIIEISVAVGDLIKADETLMILETEKATLEVPAPFAGVVKTVHVKVGDKVSEGSLIVTLEVAGEEISPSPPMKGGVTTEKSTDKDTSVGADHRVRPASELEPTAISAQNIPPSLQRGEFSKGGIVHAGPGVRRFARELGADLSRIGGSGPKNRILKADVQIYIKSMLSQIQSGNIPPGGGGISVAPWPQVDFAKFGEVSKEPLSRIKKLSGSFLHRNWVMVPHITQFDEADITELEQFRKAQQSLAEVQGVKLTPLVFIMKAVVATLKEFPWFNASLDANGAELILKKYFHILILPSRKGV